jgi:phosphoribosylaminoimidazole carboxylase
LQKTHLAHMGVDVAESVAIDANSPASLADVGSKLGYPFMLKSRTLAYDGRGNYIVHTENDFPGALRTLKDRPLYAEKWVPFTKELAVMVIRKKNGECISYPTVETVHEDSICKLVYAPARVLQSTMDKARRLAEEAVESFYGAGVFGVEMFLLGDGMAPDSSSRNPGCVDDRRFSSPQRTRSETAQFRTLHNRSLSHITIRSPHTSHH